MKHLEIEYKILIDKETYELIINTYREKISEDYIQTNYYLFHPEFNKRKYSFRIRQKNNHYELTLKTPAKLGINENTIDIDESIKNRIFNHQKVSNQIFDFLAKEQIDYRELECGYYLMTHRIDIPFQYGLLSLDENKYNGIIDYELEFEVDDPKKGYEEFLTIIHQFNLNYKENCLSKTNRFKKALKKHR